LIVTYKQSMTENIFLFWNTGQNMKMNYLPRHSFDVFVQQGEETWDYDQIS
jgi:hypothetical protein